METSFLRDKHALLVGVVSSFGPKRYEVGVGRTVILTGLQVADGESCYRLGEQHVVFEARPLPADFHPDHAFTRVTVDDHLEVGLGAVMKTLVGKLILATADVEGGVFKYERTLDERPDWSDLLGVPVVNADTLTGAA